MLTPVSQQQEIVERIDSHVSNFNLCIETGTFRESRFMYCMQEFVSDVRELLSCSGVFYNYIYHFNDLDNRLGRGFNLSDDLLSKIPSEWSFSALEWIEIIHGIYFREVYIATYEVDDVDPEKVENFVFNSPVDIPIDILALIVDKCVSKSDFIQVVREHNDLSRTFLMLPEAKRAQVFAESEKAYNLLPREEKYAVLKSCFFDEFSTSAISEEIVENFNSKIPLDLFLNIFFHVHKEDKENRFAGRYKHKTLNGLRELFIS